MSEDLRKILKELDNILASAEASIKSVRGYIAQAAPVQVPVQPVREDWDPKSLKWVADSGKAGPYEKCNRTSDPNFLAMARDLEGHGGRLTRDGFFYWLFTDGNAVGRKPRKPE